MANWILLRSLKSQIDIAKTERALLEKLFWFMMDFGCSGQFLTQTLDFADENPADLPFSPKLADFGLL